MDKKIKFIFGFCLLLFLYGPMLNAQRIYLSGTGPHDAVNWDFSITAGRNSGFLSSIPVPSNWEMHGFGHYTYGADYPDYEKNPEIGYYSTKFELPAIDGKHIRLTFEGSMTDTKIKINNVPVGDVHHGGFTRFSYDITALAKIGENHLEAEVRKSSENNAVQNAERISDYWLFGGIYRPVYIDILPEEHVERVAIDAKMNGAFKMNVYLKNLQLGDRLTGSIVDQSGHSVGKSFHVKLNPGDTLVSMMHIVKNIIPWTHESPHLYQVRVDLYQKKNLVHTYFQRFGFRTFEVRDHDGFYLNGKRVLLKGAAMHSFRPETGRALSKKDMLETLVLIKGMNANTVRPCHYPPDSGFFDLCDSLGMLALCELPGWTNPLDKVSGSKMIKEMIARDVNHPSIILWSNGNHKSHNPDLDEDFFFWDIQKRRPLKNFARVEEYPGNYSPDFDMVDTRFYPNYQQLSERLSGNRIVMPNETLHALYDGGGGAALRDYWEAMKASKVGGGLIIWALSDEGIVRTDKTNKIDVQGNMAPDGLLGPYGEKKGSYFAAKEVWAPVQIEMDTIPFGFDGTIPISNDYAFINSSECHFEWKLINFTNKDETKHGYRIRFKGAAKALNIEAGEKGNLFIDLPVQWNRHDALMLCVYGPDGSELITKVFTISPRRELAGEFVFQHKPRLTQDGNDPFVFYFGDLSLKFDADNGQLIEVNKNKHRFPVKNIPFLVAENKDNPVHFNPNKGKVSIMENEEGYKITSLVNNGFDEYSWQIYHNGNLKLNYTFTLLPDNYHYAGVGIEVDSEKVTGKRWLGNGPFRVWKNRMEGGTINVWDMEKQLSIPGKVWNFPEFEGIFSSWYWAIIRFDKELNMGISVPENAPYLGLLNPRNGDDPKFATWHYPSIEGIYLFNTIPAVGEKWKPAVDLGPSSQPGFLSGKISGSVLISFNWNQPDEEFYYHSIEIE